MQNIIMADVIAGGIAGSKITTYQIPSNDTINNVVTAANIPLIDQNEILVWNIKGTATQASGSSGVKMGIVVVQNGTVIWAGSASKQMATKTSPDNSTPNASAWVNGTFIIVSGGKYAGTSGIAYYVAGGNQIEFIQIPYNIGWNDRG